VRADFSPFEGQVVNLRPIVQSACFVGQPILAAAGFQPAFSTCATAAFCRQSPSPASVNTLHGTPKWSSYLLTKRTPLC